MDSWDFSKYLSDHYGFLIQTCIVLFLVLLFDFFQRRTVSFLLVKLETKKLKFAPALFESISKPFSLIIWTAGFSLIAKTLKKETQWVILRAFDDLADTVILGSLTWFMFRVIHRVELKWLEHGTGTDITTVEAVSKLLKASIVILAALVVLQTLGYSISGILAFGGIGGLAIGFAAKDLLANLFGGLNIYMDKPFKIGDWIRSPDREIEGTVEHIGWRLTRIRTFDKRPLYVPNSVFTNIIVENPQRMLNRRIYETIGIRYQDAPKMEMIIAQVKGMLLQHSEIDTQRTMIVNFNAFAASSLDFFVYTFTKTTDWVHFHEVKQDVLLKILNIIEDIGAETAFPTSTIHLEQDKLRKNLKDQ